jgi:hypothetical protein
MPRLLIALALVVAAAASAAPASAATTWLCRPGLADDACSTGLATTRFTPRGDRIDVERPRAGRTVDCFYVYPTVSDEAGPQASRSERPEIRSIAAYQAARFGQQCRIFAPVYRQVTLAGLGGAGGSGNVAYADVRAAFREYLSRYSHGRGFVLIGHSQGSFHLKRLVHELIDPSPALRRRMVSAILLGGNVTRDDFTHVPACRRPGQLHCVIAYSTFDETPPADAKFGRGAICTNPIALRGDGSTRLHPIFPSTPFAPGTLIAAGISLLGYTPPAATTPWVAVPGAFSAHCSRAGGANVLRVRARGGTPTLHASPDATWGLHLVDVNVALGDLVAIVGRQARAFTRSS